MSSLKDRLTSFGLLDLTLTFLSAQMWQRHLSSWATVACNWHIQLLNCSSMKLITKQIQRNIKWWSEMSLLTHWFPTDEFYIVFATGQKKEKKRKKKQKNIPIASLNTFHCSFSQSTLQGGDNPVAVDGLLRGIVVMLHGWVSQQLLEVRYLGWSPLPKRHQLYFNSPRSMVHWHLDWTHG